MFCCPLHDSRGAGTCMTSSATFCIRKKSAAHHDSLVGPVVNVQITIPDGRYFANYTQSGRDCPGLKRNRPGRSNQHSTNERCRIRTPERDTMDEQKSSPGQFSHAPKSVMWISPEACTKPENMDDNIGIGSSLLICVTCPLRFQSTQFAKS